MSLHLVIGKQDCLHLSLIDIVTAALRGGVTHVQLREKFATPKEIIETARSLQALLKDHRVPLIINDYIDIAMEIDADGIHIGQSDIAYSEARQKLGNNKIIGLTIETAAQMQIANQWQLDYVGVGPVFPTQNKLDAPSPLTLIGLKKICQSSSHPVIAIGGINVSNVVSVMQAGAAGIAVASAISHAQQPEQATLLLKQFITREKQYVNL